MCVGVVDRSMHSAAFSAADITSQITKSFPMKMCSWASRGRALDFQIAEEIFEVLRLLSTLSDH